MQMLFATRFRAHMSAATLKQLRRPCIDLERVAIPRSHERGHIDRRLVSSLRLRLR